MLNQLTRHSLDHRLPSILDEAHAQPAKRLALLDATKAWAGIDAERRNDGHFNLTLLALNATSLVVAADQIHKIYSPADCETPTCAWGGIRIAQAVLTGLSLSFLTAGACVTGVHHRLARRSLRQQEQRVTQQLEAQTGLGVFVGIYAAASAPQRAQIVRTLMQGGEA